MAIKDLKVDYYEAYRKRKPKPIRSAFYNPAHCLCDLEFLPHDKKCPHCGRENLRWRTRK